MLLVLMGVSGSGKSTIGRLLADRLGCPFLEADDFHPPENVAKLHAGTPLTDEDRWPWLEALSQGIRQRMNSAEGGGPIVLACSALKDEYRVRLEDHLPVVRWVHLKGDPRVLEARLKQRVGHFSSASILPSQFQALEPPEDAVEITVEGTPAATVELLSQALSLPSVDGATSDRLIARNLFVGQHRADAPELFDELLVGDNFRLERIVSRGHVTPEGEWYDQERPEWVLLLTGAAKLEFEGNPNPYDVAPGDAWLIPAHCRHRVAWTDPARQSLWLALHYDPADSAS